MPSELENAQSMVVAYKAAEEQILKGKEARFSAGGIDRSMRMEDLSSVRAGRAEWEARVKSLQASAAGSPRIGGLSFAVSDFSRPY